LCSSHKPQDG